MADNRTVKVNPRCIGGEVAEPVQVPAASAQTWKAGQFGYANSGLATPVATDATNVKYQFLKDQTTPTTEGDLVWVIRLTPELTFEGFISAESNGNDIDAAATTAMLYQDYGLKVGSNYTTVDTSETSNVAVVVKDIRPQYSPYTDTTSTPPGRVTFQFKASVIDA